MIEVKDAVNQIISQGHVNQLPDNFENISPVHFAKALLKALRKNDATITIHGDDNCESSELFLSTLDDARKFLTGEQFDDLWSHLRFTLDYGVMGAESWQPKILPNGGVAIRNHHRVISLSEKPEFSIEVTLEKLQKELALLNATCTSKVELEAEKQCYFSILHRDENGFTWSSTVPKTLSKVGQTLIFIPSIWLNYIHSNKLLNKKFPIICNFAIKQTADSSRSGHCVIRTFEGRIFGFSTFRASDEYDILLEEYSTPIDYEYGKGYDLEINPLDINHLVRNRTMDMSRSLNTHYLSKSLQLLIEDEFQNSYVKEKSKQIHMFSSIFGENWNQPTFRYYLDNKLSNLIKFNNGKLLAFKFGKLPLTRFKGFEKEFNKKIGSLFSSYDSNDIYIQFNIDSWQKSEPCLWKSEEYSEQIKQLIKNYKLEYNKYCVNSDPKASAQDLIEQEENFFSESNSFLVIIKSKNIPDPAYANQEGLRLSSELSQIIYAYIPCYGFEQDYCDGYLEEPSAEAGGNGQMFLV